MGIKRGLKPRLAEVGKIKIGGKGETRKKSGGNGTYQLPVRYDHFVITTTERGQDGNFVPDFNLMEKLDPRENWVDGQQYPKPKTIPVALLFDDIDLNFQTSFAFYQGAKCICRGDGEEAEMVFQKAGKPSKFRILDNEDGKTASGETHKIECNPETCPMMQPDSKGATKCKPSGILSCVLPDSMNLGGVYRLRTHSWNTISNLLASLAFIQSVTGGVLMGLPMKLQMLKKATTDHGNVNTVNIVFDGETHQQLRNAAMLEHKNRTDHNINMHLLEDNAKKAGFTVDLDEPADVEAEFYNTSEPEPEKPTTIIGRADTVLGISDEEPEPEPEQEETPAEPEAEQPELVEEQQTEPEPQEEEQPPDDGLEIF